MACRGCLECLLKLLNSLMTLVGLAMVGYGIYLFVEYRNADDTAMLLSPVGNDQDLLQFRRPMLMAVSLSSDIFDDLPKAWFIYLFIGVGVVLFVISCFGCIGAGTRNLCCLTCELPSDKTGDFDMIYEFLEKNWTILKWVALGIVILQALIFLLALMVRAANRPADYDSDDEFIAPRPQIRQPLMNRPPAPAAGVPVPTLEQRPSRNDAWSTRMREKYGLDTSEFTYNPSESNRYQPAGQQPTEERSRCTIL
ncbi:hypothetical protein V6N13_139934 [Hibiscus sabdariffa]|uniref:Tobamovirus multiplication protein 2A n=1 Tax=Hibiscus sabdariffa TaxID=183260 RepID=A0ABR2QBR3_9ROSI